MGTLVAPRGIHMIQVFKSNKEQHIQGSILVEIGVLAALSFLFNPNLSTTIFTISFHSVIAPTPMSPQARVLPMGPTTLYPTTSRAMRICSAVRGCSYISVFMAGKT